MKGWIAISKDIIYSNEWFTVPETFLFYIYCLLKANYEDGRWQNIEIKRGQFVSSLRHMSQDTRLTDSKLRTALKRLIDTGYLTSSSTNKNTLITVCKYDELQSVIGNKRQANHKPITTNNNDNNKKNINKDFIVPTLEEFEDFFIENGYDLEVAQKAYKWYDVADWKDSRGKQVKNWKQKAIQVWFIPENKIINNNRYEKEIF